MFGLADTFSKQAKFINENYAYQNEYETIKLLHTLPEKKLTDFQELSNKFLENLNKTHRNKESCAERSRSLREQGNGVYKAKSSPNFLLSACRLYTLSIFAAENVLEELCLGYANRGMALQEFGYYEQAYDDCSCALEFGYPKKLQHKLVMRQAHCAWKLGNAQKLAEHISTLEVLELNASYTQQLEELQKELEKLRCTKKDTQEALPKTPEKTHKISTADDNRGRHMIATKLIRTGELIFQEQSNCFVPTEQKHLICQQCAATLMCAPIPCTECHQRVVYCSRRCRQLQAAVHKYECAGYRMELLGIIGISHLAMRLVLQYLPEWLGMISNKTNGKVVWESLMSLAAVQYNWTTAPPHMKTLCMITHMGQFIRDELLYYILCANLVQVYLKNYTNFYEEQLGGATGEDWNVLLGALILRCAGQLVVNGHVVDAIIHSTLSEPTDFALLQPKLWLRPFHLKSGYLHKFSATCLIRAINLPYLSLLNHACEASIDTKFDGCVVSNYAAREIKEGEEIFNCYAVDCRNSLTSSRQEELQSTYNFYCRCTKCLRTDPDQDCLAFHRHRCENPKCSQIFVPVPLLEQFSLNCGQPLDKELSFCCTNCHAPQSAAWYNQFLVLVERGCHAGKVRHDLYKAFKELHKWLVDYHIVKLYLARELIVSCFAAKEDGCNFDATDYTELAGIMQFLLAGTAAQWGKNSLAYITKITYLWDLIAWSKLKYDAKELKAMRASLEYLNDEMKQIFVNYYNDFINIV